MWGHTAHPRERSWPPSARVAHLDHLCEQTHSLPRSCWVGGLRTQQMGTRVVAAQARGEAAVRMAGGLGRPG